MNGETRFSSTGSSRNPRSPAARFTRSVWLPASPAAVFAFHENPQNLERISPASLRLHRIEAEPHARVGGRFRIVARQFFVVPIDWIGEWLVVEPPAGEAAPCRLVDGAVAARIGGRWAGLRFARFDHEHRFELENGGTRMTDEVTYAALGPGWGLVGAVANAIVRWMVLVPMFQGRHAVTRRYFSA